MSKYGMLFFNPSRHFLKENMKVIQKLKTIYAQRSCRSTAAYPAYKPDSAPSDYHLFSTLKEFLGGRCFKRDEEVQDAAKERLNELAAEVYDEGI